MNRCGVTSVIITPGKRIHSSSVGSIETMGYLRFPGCNSSTNSAHANPQVAPTSCRHATAYAAGAPYPIVGGNREQLQQPQAFLRTCNRADSGSKITRKTEDQNDTQRRMLTEEIMTDLVIVAGNGKEMKCHKAFLAGKLYLFII